MATAAVTFTFAPNSLIKASEANTNFQDLVTFLNNDVVHRDGSKSFTNVPNGPALDPTSDNQFTRKRYVDVRDGLCVVRIDGQAKASTSNLTALTGWTSVINQPSGLCTATTNGITINTAGTYYVSLMLAYIGGSGGVRSAKILLNGTSTLVEDVVSNISSPLFDATSTIHIGQTQPLTAGTTLGVISGQNSNSSATLFCQLHAMMKAPT